MLDKKEFLCAGRDQEGVPGGIQDGLHLPLKVVGGCGEPGRREATGATSWAPPLWGWMGSRRGASGPGAARGRQAEAHFELSWREVTGWNEWGGAGRFESGAHRPCGAWTRPTWRGCRETRGEQFWAGAGSHGHLGQVPFEMLVRHLSVGG